jgi:hypothetical protein
MTYRRCYLTTVVTLLATGAAGCGDDEPASLTLSGPPSAVVSISGNNQTGTAGAVLPNPLVIEVTDGQGTAVPAVPVEWSVTGGTLSRVIDSTGNSGRSSVSWTMPAEPGTYKATATVSGLPVITFDAKATPGGGLLTFRYIDAGSYHSCGIATDEQLYCWGYNGDGQLGLPAGDAKPYPNLVPNVQRFRSVSGGRYHTCGVTLSGGIICWGQNRDNRAIPGDPVSFQAVQAGLLHTCGLNMSREIWCWGSNGEGQVGPVWTPLSGIITNGPTPAGSHTVALKGFSANQWLPYGTVLTQADFFGGSRIVIKDLQANALGQITVEMDAPTTVPMPDSTEVDVSLATSIPGAVEALVRVGDTYKAVTTGGLHTCGIKENGTAWCWGFNAEGQLGTNGPLRIAPVPTQVVSQVGFRTDPMIVPPSPDPDFPLPPGPFIAAGHEHTCALGQDGATYCWGLNENGQLGDGTTGSHPTPHAVSAALIFERITAGQRHTCGLTGAGTAYCWGDNTHGQLGDGTKVRHLVPTPVSGGQTFAYLKAGDLSTCGVTTTGVGYCWGDNEYGQIGNGLRTSVLVPTKIAFQP